MANKVNLKNDVLFKTINDYSVKYAKYTKVVKNYNTDKQEAVKELKSASDKYDALLKDWKEGVVREELEGIDSFNAFVSAFNPAKEEAQRKINAVNEKYKKQLTDNLKAVTSIENGLIMDEIAQAVQAMLKKGSENASLDKILVKPATKTKEAVFVDIVEGKNDVLTIVKNFLEKAGAKNLEKSINIEKITKRLILGASGYKLVRSTGELKTKNSQELKAILLLTLRAIMIDDGIITLDEKTGKCTYLIEKQEG